jgi:hypothetical protein
MHSLLALLTASFAPLFEASFGSLAPIPSGQLRVYPGFLSLHEQGIVAGPAVNSGSVGSSADLKAKEATDAAASAAQAASSAATLAGMAQAAAVDAAAAMEKAKKASAALSPTPKRDVTGAPVVQALASIQRNIDTDSAKASDDKAEKMQGAAESDEHRKDDSTRIAVQAASVAAEAANSAAKHAVNAAKAAEDVAQHPKTANIEHASTAKGEAHGSVRPPANVPAPVSQGIRIPSDHQDNTVEPHDHTPGQAAAAGTNVLAVEASKAATVAAQAAELTAQSAKTAANRAVEAVQAAARSDNPGGNNMSAAKDTNLKRDEAAHDAKGESFWNPLEAIVQKPSVAAHPAPSKRNELDVVTAEKAAVQAAVTATAAELTARDAAIRASAASRLSESNLGNASVAQDATSATMARSRGLIGSLLLGAGITAFMFLGLTLLLSGDQIASLPKETDAATNVKRSRTARC